MKFNDKILTFLTLITNAYRSEKNQEFTQQMTLDDENLTEDFTAMVFALNMFFNKVTGGVWFLQSRVGGQSYPYHYWRVTHWQSLPEPPRTLPKGGERVGSC